MVSVSPTKRHNDWQISNKIPLLRSKYVFGVFLLFIFSRETKIISFVIAMHKKRRSDAPLCYVMLKLQFTKAW